MAYDNLTACYEAVLRVYRNAVVGHLRETLTRQYGEAAPEQLKRLFKKEWEHIEAAVAERQVRLSVPITDCFDMLGVNHFYNLAEVHFDLLSPSHLTNDPMRGRAREALLAWMKSIKNLRDAMAHPSEMDFDHDDAIEMLYCARKVLDFLKLKSAADEVQAIRRKIDQRNMTADHSARINLLQKIFVNGRGVYYLDNKASSRPGILVFYLHGLGLDCRDFYAAMNSSYRSIAPTMVGFHPGDAIAANLSLTEHCTLLSKFFEHCIEGVEQVNTVIVVGFSVGADLAFQILRDAKWVTGRSVGFLSLDCNLSSDTCFISKELAEMDVSSPTATVMRIAQEATVARGNDLRRWLAIHEYLVKVFKKQARNIASLKVMATEFRDRFADPEPTVFLDSCRDLAKTRVSMRFVFSDDPAHRRLVDSSPIAAQHDLLIEIEPSSGHFDLVEEAIRLEEYVKDMVSMVGLD